MPRTQLSSLSRAALQEPAIDLAKHEASNWTNTHCHLHSPSIATSENPGLSYQHREGTSHRLLSSSAVRHTSEVCHICHSAAIAAA